MSASCDLVQTLITAVDEYLTPPLVESQNSTPYQLRYLEAVILFQAAMEAFINEEIATNKLLAVIQQEERQLNAGYRSLSFRNKWIRAFELLDIEDQQNLNTYLEFYSTYRVPITHPKSRYISLEKYQYEVVRDGINAGTKAMELLRKSSYNTEHFQLITI